MSGAPAPGDDAVPAGPDRAPEDGAPFDDTRRALRFALNAHRPAFPQSAMSRAMAEARIAPGLSRRAAVRRVQVAERAAQAEADAGRRLRAGPWPAAGLDRAHLAGYVLQKFDQLEEHHRLVLAARLIVPATPCTCGSRCCSGWAAEPLWLAAVERLCEVVRLRAHAAANEGRDPALRPRAGLSTQPLLRRQVVREWAAGRGRESSLVSLALRLGLTELTVATHRAWIVAWLDATEDEAWSEADVLLARHGITGPAP